LPGPNSVLQQGAHKLQEKAAEIALNSLYLVDRVRLLRARRQAVKVAQRIRTTSFANVVFDSGASSISWRVI
jgi:hypothetical protein